MRRRVEPSRISARRARGVWNERSERHRTSGWGPDYPANYGMLYTAKGTAALLVPLGNVLTTWTGSWTAVFVIAAILNNWQKGRSYDRLPELSRLLRNVAMSSLCSEDRISRPRERLRPILGPSRVQSSVSSRTRAGSMISAICSNLTKILQRGSYSPIAAQGRACPVCPPPMQPDVKLDDTAVDGVLGYTQGSPWGCLHSWPRNGASFAPRETRRSVATSRSNSIGLVRS